MTWKYGTHGPKDTVCERCGEMIPTGEGRRYRMKWMHEGCLPLRPGETGIRFDDREQDGESATLPGVETFSPLGGSVLILALFLLVMSAVWQESIRDQISNLDSDSSSPTQWQDLDNSAMDADRLWKFGVILAVLGAIIVALTQVKKHEGI